ncbi:Septin-7 [Schistosoma japonicum]|nr:Septin-7 [Schistosoma japonicum]
MVAAVPRSVMIKVEDQMRMHPLVDSKFHQSCTQKSSHAPVVPSNNMNKICSSNNTDNNSLISASKISFEDRTVRKVGFSNLPNQIHRKAVRRGFVFNLMITGNSGLGKSTFINSLFSTDFYNADYPGPSKRSHPSGTCVDSKTFALSEANVSLLLTIIDTPGFGSDLDNSLSWKPLIKHIDSRFESYLRAELNVSRVTVGSGATYQINLPDDKRVHLCLYFISPNGHGLHQLDVETLKQLHKRVNTVVIIGKADSLTPDECNQFKQTILRELYDHNIKLYDFPESVAKLGSADESHSTNEIRQARERQPFAVVTSTNLVTLPDGRKVYGRSYPWGIVECDNLEHNDFHALKHLLMSVHMQVHERTNKLIETERDLVERAEQSEKHIITQLAEFEKRRQEFEDERAIWEAENREYLEALQISVDRSDCIKEKFRIKRKGLF